MPDLPDLDSIFEYLKQSDEYRLLRRLHMQDVFDPNVTDELIGIIVDVETTGLNLDNDDVIELGMIKFSFDKTGSIGKVIGRFNSFNEPRFGIPEDITDLTGISYNDVQGISIDTQEVMDFVSDASIVIAHNAYFDRPFCERIADIFVEKAWACTATQINWQKEGVSGAKLEYLLSYFGFFYDAHRAIDDCNAALHLLSLPLPRSSGTTLSNLLQIARRVEARIFATTAPYEIRDFLKRAGYRWNDGVNGQPRAWWKDVPLSEVDLAIASLSNLYHLDVRPTTVRITARDRFRRIAV